MVRSTVVEVNCAVVSAEDKWASLTMAISVY